MHRIDTLSRLLCEESCEKSTSPEKLSVAVQLLDVEELKQQINHDDAILAADASNLPPVATVPFPKDGIKLSVLRKMIDNHPTNLAGMTTTDVCTTIVFPATLERKCSYNDLQVYLGNGHLIGKPAMFVSHAWRYEFVRVVEALEAHILQGDEDPDPFVWFDLCCNSQHDTSDRPMEWWKTTFLEAIRDIGRTVMVMEPWEDPVPLTRAWCVWEVLCTCQTAARFEIAMTRPQRERFITALRHEYGSIMKMVCRIDCRRAEAWKESDRVGIMQCVETTIGFVQMNAVVVSCIRTWILGMAKLEIGAFTKRSVVQTTHAPTQVVGKHSSSVKGSKVVPEVSENPSAATRGASSGTNAVHQPSVGYRKQHSHARINCNISSKVDEGELLSQAPGGGDDHPQAGYGVQEKLDWLSDPLGSDLAVETVKLLRDQNLLQDALQLGEECLRVRRAAASAAAASMVKVWTKRGTRDGSGRLPAGYLAKTTELLVVLADINWEMGSWARSIPLIDEALALHHSIPDGRRMDRLDIQFCQVAVRINLGRRGGVWLFLRWLVAFRGVGRDRWKVFISDSARRPGLLFNARNFMTALRIQHDLERHVGVPRGRARFLNVFEAFLGVVAEEYGQVHPTTLMGMMVVGRELTKLGTPEGWQRAETMQRAAVDGAVVSIGKTRREMVSALMGLADCLEGQGKYAEALAVFERTARACEDVHPRHSTFLSLCGMARCQRALRLLQESLLTLDAAQLEAEDKFKLPPRHPLLSALQRSRADSLLALAGTLPPQEGEVLRKEGHRLHKAHKRGSHHLQNWFINAMNGLLFGFLGAPS